VTTQANRLRSIPALPLFTGAEGNCEGLAEQLPEFILVYVNSDRCARGNSSYSSGRLSLSSGQPSDDAEEDGQEDVDDPEETG
jgi:hypothetical protein